MRLRSAVLASLVVLTALSALSCVVVPYEQPRRTPPPPPAPPMWDDVSIFYDQLAPYGDWFWLDPYGWVWTPALVAPYWRPYTYGRWLHTHDGWLWVSEEAFGWAVYHYGRWFFDPAMGWVWVPGREWAPAWVAWRHGRGWVGWAPLPPRAVWRAGVGLDLGRTDLMVELAPAYWCFVETRYMHGEQLHPRIAPSARNVTLVQVTQNVTNYIVVDNRIVNRGVNADELGAETGRQVPRYRVMDAGPAEKEHKERVEGDVVRVQRKELKEAPKDAAPRRSLSRPPRRETTASSGQGAAPPPPKPTPPPTDERPTTATRPPQGGAPPPAPQPPAPPSSQARPVGTGRPQSGMGMPESSLSRRQDAERRELDRKHANGRKELQRRQYNEERTLPPDVTTDEMRRRHEAERKELEAQVEREKKLLEERHRRERDLGRIPRQEKQEEKPGKSPK